MSFTSMDQSTREQWMSIADANAALESYTPERIKRLLCELESRPKRGMTVNQLQHALQTATRAQRAGASEEMIVAALCHDIGKCFSDANHAGISAEILKPFVSDDTYQIIKTHQEFQGRYYYRHFGKDADARWLYRFKPWYKDASRFTDEWDQAAFDPDYDSLPLSFFEPMIDRVFGHPRAEHWQTGGRLPLFLRALRKLGRLLRIV